MAATVIFPSAADAGRFVRFKGHDSAIMLLFLLFSTAFLYLDPRVTPIVLWDESRNVVNALEMRHAGLSLVTTYGFQPDLWNTKPPLLIWLMTGAMAVFGPTEWALRLPSMLAALGTLLIVVRFVRAATGSIGTAILAAALILLSPGFFGPHGARTADYDVLLTFFTTAYLCLLYLAVTRPTPGLKLLALAGVMITGAVMTKALAALVPGVGVLLFLLIRRRAHRLWHRLGYLLMAIVAAVPILAFAIAREAAAQGYIAAALHNDLFGRISQSLVGRGEPAWFYLAQIGSFWFLAGPMLVLAAFGLGAVRGRARLLMLYCLCTAGSLIVLLSFSSTKLPHYLLPAIAPLSIATALLLRAAWLRFGRTSLPPAIRLALLLIAALPVGAVAARAIQARYVTLAQVQFYPRALYGEMLESLAKQGHARVRILEHGLILEGVPGYAPQLRAYQLMWRERGPIVIATDAAITASCDPAIVSGLRAHGSDLVRVPGCVAVHIPQVSAARA